MKKKSYVDELKQLMDEREHLKGIVKLIEDANDDYNWIYINSPKNKEGVSLTAYNLNLDRPVLVAAKARLKEIEDFFNGFKK